MYTSSVNIQCKCKYINLRIETYDSGNHSTNEMFFGFCFMAGGGFSILSWERQCGEFQKAWQVLSCDTSGDFCGKYDHEAVDSGFRMIFQHI